MKIKIELLLLISESGIIFIPLDLDTISMADFVDAGFSANPDSSSQLEFWIALMNEDHKFNIIHYGSVKSKRITRIAPESEHFAIVQGIRYRIYNMRCVQLNV